MTTPSLPLAPSTEPERRRNPRLLLLLLVALCVVFAAGYFERLARLEQARQDITTMRHQVAASRQRHANLQAELERVQDPYYLALLARDDIGLVQEGDLPVVVYEGPTPTPSPAVESASPPEAEGQATWRQWLELIFP